MKIAVASLGLVALAAAGAACLLTPGYYAFLIGTIAATALVGIGLNILFGLAGEVSLGQIGFVALGAYALAIFESAGLPFWPALIVTVALVAGISALLSVPALRVTGPYLAMVTIAFGFIVESAAIELRDLTGGASGLSGIKGPFGTGGTALLACIACALALVGFAWLARSPLGLAMRATATAPNAARAIGISPLAVRTAAFILAAALAGLAGALTAALNGFIAPSSFPFSQSIFYLLVVMIGGAGWTLGPLFGAIVVGLLPEVLAGLAEYRLLVFGAALLVVLWVAPGGIAGLLGRLLPARRGEALAGTADIAREKLRGVGKTLKADSLRVAFGGLVAVNDVAFVAEAGCVTSVIGPNGAGKTTLLNIVSGFQKPDGGTITLGNESVSGLTAHALAQAGIARTFQTAQPFAGLSVLDNIRLGLLRGKWRADAPADLARDFLALAGFTGRDDVAADSLPHVDRRLLEIARALATKPSVLLLDEPAAGLDAADTAKLDGVLRALANAGLAVVLVEHDMSLVMSVSDTIVVLDSGKRIAMGNPAQVRADPAVRAAYLGATAPPTPRSVGRTPGSPLLDVRALHAGYTGLRVLESIDLAVRQGETLAVLGPNGAGKSTLMKALSGLLRPVSGSITLRDTPLAHMSAHDVARHGLTLVPEGRQVFPHLTVVENLRLGASRHADIDEAEIEEMLVRFPRLRPKVDTPAGLLSGGEQQMMAVARGLLSRPDILLLDEPSLGLAPAIAAELFASLAKLRDDGMTLVIVDQMTDYALSIADRGIVLGHGKIVAQGTAAELRATALDDAYLGGTEQTAEAVA